MQNNIFLLDNRKDNRIKYRNRLDVMAAVIEATASGRVTRSIIFNKSFLNYESFRSTMSFLIEREFVEMSGNENDDGRLYRQQKMAYISYMYTIT